MTDARLNFIALGSVAYTLVRFIEAYGLWYKLRWTEWFALVSGAIYIPFEIRELYLHVNALSISALLINSYIVWYMTYVLLSAPKT